jgi:ATP-dependent DNA helicase DinG
VYWLDKSPDIKEKFKPNQRTSISNKPIEVGRDIFSSFLRREDLSCIFTSATLSTNGNFNFIKAQTGICECPPERVWEYIGESPFDLTKQQWWYFPENTVAGNDPKFAESLPLHIEQIVGACEGGALCLFTSVSNMRKTYEIVAPILEAKYGIRSFMQYQAPAPVLIDEFKNDVDSVLFATRSFFTGVDVPGYALRCLIIDKLPFPMAGDPMMEKLVQLYGFGGMFENYSVPMMLITLKQAVGRGVRSIHDKCVVSILDSRMLKTERERFSRRSCYKDQFRPTFPWNRGSQKLDDIKRFLFPGKEI